MDVTPEAKEALALIFDEMKENYAEFGADSAIFKGRELLEENGALSASQKNHIVCSAFASILVNQPIENTNPYSELGLDIFQAVSAFIHKELWAVEEALELKEDSLPKDGWQDD